MVARIKIDLKELDKKKAKAVPAASKPAPPPIKTDGKGKLCTFCNHIYINPCNGENKACGNYIHASAPKAKKGKK